MKKNSFGSLDTKDEKEIREMEEALKEKYDSAKEKCLSPEELLQLQKTIYSKTYQRQFFRV